MLKPNKFYLLSFLVLTGVLGIWAILFLPEKEKVMADVTLGEELKKGANSNLPIIQKNTFLSPALPSQKEFKVAQRVKVIVTGYSSSIWETQGDPFITASGQKVRDGIVANNLLPFGTKIRLPELFGDKIFEVQDRMNSKKGYYHVDVWFPSREEALNFGWKITTMEILK